MPKDPTKNIDRYKIRGGTLNEREFDENQEAYEKQKSKKGGGNLIPGTPPEKANEASKTRKSTKKAAKNTTKTVATRGASAKKLAARKAAKKK